MILANVLNLFFTYTFSNECSGAPRVQPKLHMVQNVCRKQPQAKRIARVIVETYQKVQMSLAHLIRSLPAAVINLVQKVELLYETSSTSHVEYFLVFHVCARNADEPPQNTTKYATKTQESPNFTHVQNPELAPTFNNGIS